MIHSIEEYNNYKSYPMEYKYTKEQLQEIERLAKLLTPLNDIAILLDLNMFDLQDEIVLGVGPAAAVYARGKALAMLELRTNNLRMAKLGAPAGLQAAADYIAKMTTQDTL